MLQAGPRLYKHRPEPSPVAPSNPVPVQIRRITQETDEGPMTDFLIVWQVGTDEHCQFCPAAECTFLAARDGIGSCVIRTRGHRDSPFAIG